MSCGYEIVGVAVGGHCPECGSVIRQFAVQGGQTQGKAIAALVLGICAIVMSCMTYGVAGLPCGILAVIFAKQARLAVQNGTAPVSSLGMATAGRVCGWIGLALSGVFLLLLAGMIVLSIVGTP
jgi:hypothetical protein